MDSGSDSNIEENYNFKTGITEEFSDLDVEEFNESWFNEDSDLNIKKLDETTVNRMQIYTKFNIPVSQRDNGEIKFKATAMTCKSAATTQKKNKQQPKRNLSKKVPNKIIIFSDSEKETISNKKHKSESNELYELEIEEQK
ncbi:912_t:CDS:2 [Dentiscutata erythropus]|uniref:912_t:CDS:1 n=1 Tax=Dentiscutata erythropus TaxID=1348616 RepID=A0A9N9D2P4_9GLOM|nr:912_t:CDS:2 [Dentiscutata erythropus]